MRHPATAKNWCLVGGKNGFEENGSLRKLLRRVGFRERNTGAGERGWLSGKAGGGESHVVGVPAIHGTRGVMWVYFSGTGKRYREGVDREEDLQVSKGSESRCN